MGSTRLRILASIAIVMGAGCADPEPEGVDERATPRVADWAVSAEIGTQLGPFPTDAAMTDPDSSDWFAVVLPAVDPIDAFHALLADAAGQGFDTGTGPGGPCRQSWSREEVTLGEDVDGDGDGFQGETPFGEELPRGAVVVAVTCEADIEGGGERVAVSTQVPLQVDPATGPVRHPPILLFSPSDVDSTVEVDRQDVDLPMPSYASGPITAEEVGGFLLDTVEPLAPLGWASYPNSQGGCAGVALRSTGPPEEAVDTVIGQSPWRASFEERSSDREVAGRRAVVRRGSTAGAVFFATAVQTPSGSDVFICAIDA